MTILRQQSMIIGSPHVKLWQIITSSIELGLDNSNQSVNRHILLVVNKYSSGYNTDRTFYGSHSLKMNRCCGPEATSYNPP